MCKISQHSVIVAIEMTSSIQVNHSTLKIAKKDLVHCSHQYYHSLHLSSFTLIHATPSRKHLFHIFKKHLKSINNANRKAPNTEIATLLNSRH